MFTYKKEICLLGKRGGFFLEPREGKRKRRRYIPKRLQHNIKRARPMSQLDEASPLPPAKRRRKRVSWADPIEAKPISKQSAPMIDVSEFKAKLARKNGFMHGGASRRDFVQHMTALFCEDGNRLLETWQHDKIEPTVDFALKRWRFNGDWEQLKGSDLPASDWTIDSTVRIGRRFAKLTTSAEGIVFKFLAPDNRDARNWRLTKELAPGIFKDGEMFANGQRVTFYQSPNSSQTFGKRYIFNDEKFLKGDIFVMEVEKETYYARVLEPVMTGSAVEFLEPIAAPTIFWKSTKRRGVIRHDDSGLVIKGKNFYAQHIELFER